MWNVIGILKDNISYFGKQGLIQGCCRLERHGSCNEHVLVDEACVVSESRDHGGVNESSRLRCKSVTATFEDNVVFVEACHGSPDDRTTFFQSAYSAVQFHFSSIVPPDIREKKSRPKSIYRR